MRAARDRDAAKQEKFYTQLALEITNRTNIEIGLDTATRFFERQMSYDPGPGLTIKRPKNSRIH